MIAVGIRFRRLFYSLILYSVLIIFLIVVTFPFYWMLLTSLRSPRDVFQRDRMLLLRNPTLNNYRDVVVKRGALVWIANSSIVAFSSSIMAGLISTLAAYSLIRLKYPGKRFWIRSIILMYLVPRSLMFIPIFITFNELNLHDTRLGLILSHLTFTVPFMTWFLMGYIKGLPQEIEEAALVDGCGRLDVFIRIVVPLIGPGLTAAWIFAFTRSWNEFIFASVLIVKSTLKTIPVAIYGFLLGDIWLWGSMMATSVISIIPALILYMLASRFMTKGLITGAIKG